MLLKSQPIQSTSGTTNAQLSSATFQVSPQYQSMVPVNSNQYLDALAAQPGQFAAVGQQTQQLSQQPLLLQQPQQSGTLLLQQPQQSGTQLFHQSSQPQPQHPPPSFLYEQQTQSVQQAAIPQSSQYPSFPSFNQFALSVS